jgi:hypothetical protein
MREIDAKSMVIFVKHKRSWYTWNVYPKMLIVRNLSYFEYLVVPKDGKLVLPDDLPFRFNTRIESYFENGIVVQSIPHQKKIITRKGILEGNGVWIVADDCTKRGQYGDVDGIRQFMSVEIDEDAAKKIKNHSDSQTSFKPLSLYHGTTPECIEKIFSFTICPSYGGMLGDAVYVGTFWKAVRFATMTQDYKHREGALLRVLVMARSVVDLPRPGWYCKCEDCLSSRKINQIADHDGTFLNTFDCVHVNTCDKLKNEEWALGPMCMFVVTHAAIVDPSSLGGAHHDPLYRKSKII